MKKKASYIAAFLSCAILVAGILLSPLQAEAKSGPRLSEKSYSLTMEAGKNTFSLRLIGGKGKSNWSVTKGSDVISLKKENKKRYTVSARKVGNAIISVKTGRKVLQCKVEVVDLKAPSLGVKSSANCALLKWSGVTAADYYEIYRKTGKGSYYLLRTFRDDNNEHYVFADYTVASGEVYTYKIKSVYKNIKSNDSKEVTVKIPYKKGRRFSGVK
ncbi:hypothetical protein [Eubacterium oxidoreducens]|uniref:Fibronectin type-III domain-containing protein n=1 Tax=Eubacterium oxidoreducens TaxID=1732 RepID=A0A1G6AHQ2_EUBOX|nr:hypothetical protein [Eubacterium oxidoreducens]SDB07663.1 hypothetical protein SAMN02910417_00577 [Eubacterium oxidoreducens]